MKVKFPIYIPSTGRAGALKTPRLLDKFGLEYYVVVERDEGEEYKRLYPNAHVLLLPDSNYGTSSVARNYCIQHSKIFDYPAHWQLDDDISNVFCHNKAKVVHRDLVKIMTELEWMMVARPICAMVGIRVNNFLKQVTKSISVNSSITSFFLVRNTSMKFRGTMLVDMDYQLQALKKGYILLRRDDFAFSFAPPGKQPGGYSHIYNDDKRRIAAIKEFLKNNPDVDSTINRNSAGYLVLKNARNIWKKYK